MNREPASPQLRALWYQRTLTTRQAQLEAAWKCGKALTEVKTGLVFGAWLPWLGQVGIAPRTAQRLMYLFRNCRFDQLGRYGSVSEALRKCVSRS